MVPTANKGPHDSYCGYTCNKLARNQFHRYVTSRAYIGLDLRLPFCMNRRFCSTVRSCRLDANVKIVSNRPSNIQRWEFALDFRAELLLLPDFLIGQSHAFELGQG